MRPSVAAAVASAAGLVVALGGCSTALSGLGVATACTAMGDAEGVDVDLADVLDPEGGDDFAEVSVPAAGASSVRGFAGNDEHHPSGDVAADLDGEPTTVAVVVRDESGREVCTARGTATVAEPREPCG